MPARWKIIFGVMVGLMAVTSTIMILLGLRVRTLQTESADLRQQLAESSPTEQSPKTPEQELYFAVTHGQRGVLKKVLDEHPELVNTTNANHLSTPLHVAAFNGRAWMVEELIRRKASINATNGFGLTALHNAITSGNADTLNVLLKGKPDFTIRNMAGKTPLQHALAKNRTEFADLLRQAGATE